MSESEPYMACPICGEERQQSGLILPGLFFATAADMIVHFAEAGHIAGCYKSREGEWRTTDNLTKCFCGQTLQGPLPDHIKASLRLPKQVTVLQMHHIRQHYLDAGMGVCAAEAADEA